MLTQNKFAPLFPMKDKNRVKASPLPQNFTIGTRELAAALDEPIVYISQYAQAVHSVTAGYLLSFLTTDTELGEWMAMSSIKVQDSIGLSKHTFIGAKDVLLKLNVLEHKRTPDQSLYRINDEVLSELMTKFSSLQTDDLICPPLRVNRLHARALTQKKLSIKSVLYLSALQERSEEKPFAERTSHSNWFEAANSFLEWRTVLSKHEQLEACRQLIKEGVIESRRQGFPAVREFRISYERLAVLTAHFLQRSQQ